MRYSAHVFLIWVLPLAAGEYADIHAFEDALVKAETVQFEVRIEASGGVTAQMSGSVAYGRPNHLRMDCAGSFMGADVVAKLFSDGTTMTTARGQEPTPADLGDAVLVGLVRQGLLHNLAVMSAGGAPDGTHGETRKRFALLAVPARAATRDGLELTELAFKITYDGKEVGEGTLYLDRASQLPVLRTQIVRFPQGAMQVEERYSAFRLNAKLPDLGP